MADRGDKKTGKARKRADSVLREPLRRPGQSDSSGMPGEPSSVSIPILSATSWLYPTLFREYTQLGLLPGTRGRSYKKMLVEELPSGPSQDRSLEKKDLSEVRTGTWWMGRCWNERENCRRWWMGRVEWDVEQFKDVRNGNLGYRVLGTPDPKVNVRNFTRLKVAQW